MIYTSFHEYVQSLFLEMQIIGINDRQKEHTAFYTNLVKYVMTIMPYNILYSERNKYAYVRIYT